MVKQNILRIGTRVFLGLSILSIGYVSLFSLLDPQATMDLVQVSLSNTDAISSIRGIYGGVGTAITVSLVFLFFRNPKQGIAFLVLFWGAYALSRAITWMADGPLGAFGTQWLVIESFFCVLALFLLLLNRRHSTSDV